MKLSTKIILPIILISTLLILLNGCLGTVPNDSPGYTPGSITGRIMVPIDCTECQISDCIPKSNSGVPSHWIPVEGAIVTVIPHATLTDEDGYYTFSDIEPGVYYVITATYGNLVLKDIVEPPGVKAGETYDAGTANCESTALGLIVEALLDMGLDTEDIELALEIIKENPKFDELVDIICCIIEDCGNVTLICGVDELVQDIIDDEPGYTPEDEEPGLTPELESIEITNFSPEPMNLCLVDTGSPSSGTITTMAYYSVGDSVNISTLATYTAVPTGVVSIAGNVVTSTGLGSTTITATYQGETAPTTVTVTVTDCTTLEEIEIVEFFPEPMDLCLSGTGSPDSGTITTMAYYSTGDPVNISSLATYTADPAGVVSIAGNVVTSTGLGSTTITATYQGETAPTTVTVTVTDCTTLESITVSPNPMILCLTNTGTPDSGTITTTAYYSDGSSATVTPNLYDGYDTGVISVDTNGSVNSIGLGSTTITVSYEEGGITATAIVDVTVSDCTGYYTLTVNIVGNGSVTLTPPGGIYPSGTVVGLDPQAALGWTFVGWSGNLGGNADPATITMDSNKSVTATFTQDEYTLTVNISPAAALTAGCAVTKAPDQATYTYNTVVSLDAVPAAGWAFSHWSGDLTGSADPKDITMDGDKTVTAVFTQEGYTLTVNISPAAALTAGCAVTKAPDQATYTYNTVVSLDAVPAAGWAFSHWSGDLTGSADPKDITMDGDKTVTAVFTQEGYTLTVNISPAAALTAGCAVTKAPDQATYTYNTVVSLDAVPAAGWAFSHWSGDLTGSADPKDITMDGDKTVTAVFTQEGYTLTVNISPAAALTAGCAVTKAPDQATYTYNTVVSLDAVPAAGWAFSHWSGDLTGSADPKDITMDGDKTVTAVFTQEGYTLTVNISPAAALTAGCAVTKAPDQATYTYNTVVSLDAVPAAGWAFSHWSGDLTGSADPKDITMDGDKTVTAVFTQEGYTLTVNISPAAALTAGCAVTKAPDQATYTYNTVVSLDAVPAAGWAFSHWSGDLTGSADPKDITMDGDKTVTAVFTQEGYTLTVNISPAAALTAGCAVTKAPDQATYTYNTVVSLDAVPAAGWAFSHWSGDLTGSADPKDITMDGDKTVTAVFTQEGYTLTVNISPAAALTAGCAVTKAPDQATYTYNTVVSLDAVPAAGWAFSHWSGDLTGSADPKDITMDGDKTVTANFELKNILNFLLIRGYHSASSCNGLQKILEITSPPAVPHYIETGLWLYEKDHTPNVKHINFIARFDSASALIEYRYNYRIQYKDSASPEPWVGWSTWSSSGTSLGEDTYGYGFESDCMRAPSNPANPAYYCYQFELEIRVNGNTNTYLVHVD